MKTGRYAQLVAIAFFAATAQSGQAEEGQPPTPARVGTDAAPSKEAPGMKVYIDPQTGAFLSEPAPGTTPLVLSPADTGRFSTSHQGLVETPSPVPGGGVGLDLQGRFQSPLTATVGADGKMTTRHQHLDGASADKK